MTASFEKLFVAPVRERQALFGYTDHSLHELCELDSWPITHATAVGETGWIACRDSESQIRVARYEESSGLVDQRMVYAPDTVKVACILVDGHRLYAGGRSQTVIQTPRPHRSKIRPWVGWLDLSNPEADWILLTDEKLHDELPDKGVDAFALSPSHLIALDNMMKPLLALRFYRGTEQRAPKFTDILPLPTHYTYETVKLSAHSEQYVAFLSSGINHGFSRQFISVSYQETFPKECAVFTQKKGRGLSILERPTIEKVGPFFIGSYDWHDIDLYDDYVVIAAGENGLGLADIEEDDGAAYVTVNGFAAMIVAMPTGSHEVALSTIRDRAWKTELFSIPVDQLRKNQELALLNASPSLPSFLRKRFSIRYGLTRTDLVPDRHVPFNVFVRDGILDIEIPGYFHRDDKLVSLNAKISMELSMSGLHRNEDVDFERNRIDLSKSEPEKVGAFLTDCVEFAQTEL